MCDFHIQDIDTKDGLWSDALRAMPHDVYQHPGYADASSIADQGAARAIVVSDNRPNLLLPYIRRELAGNLWDAISPYGYASPIWNTDCTDLQRLQVFTAALNTLQHLGCVSILLRGHPYLGYVWPSDTQSLSAHSNLAQTVTIDLTESPESMWFQTSSGHRNEINRAERAGYTTAWDKDFAWFRHFKESYLADMQRLGAHHYYLFHDEYFETLRERLGPHLRLAIATLHGEFAAGALFLLHKPMASYHLSTMTSLHRRLSPTKALLHYTRLSLASEGYSQLHLGGGLGGARDSLFRFKAGFSQHRTCSLTSGFILNHPEYRRMVELRAMGATYFPAYRNPAILPSREFT